MKNNNKMVNNQKTKKDSTLPINLLEKDFLEIRQNVINEMTTLTDEDYKIFITVKGKGWICETDSIIVGFAIADLNTNNIWALFVDPDFEGKGIGKKLHKIMLDWYFAKTKITVWLSTEFHTRAENFYKKAGWIEVGLHKKKETKFEMKFGDWVKTTNR